VTFRMSTSRDIEADRAHATKRFRPIAADTIVFATLALLGLAFWFLLGFPYANHNESFAIVAQLKDMGLGSVLTQTPYPVANYRPLGQAVAWIGYRSGGTIFPVEVFNFVVAAVAWVLLFMALRERKLFALTALIVGGVFFTGYIYLFHLHGVFYSPLLLLVATLFWVDRGFDRKRLIILTLCALVAAFFHPYALLVYLAGLAGMVVERRGSLAGLRRMITVFLVAALLLFVVLVIFPRHASVPTKAEMYDGLLASYKMVEINLIASVAALCLAVITALSLPGSAWLRYGTAIGTGIVGLLFIHSGVPVLFLWIMVCLFKALLMKKWWMVLVLGCAALFPAPTATGSPTYVIFVLMISAAILPYGWTRFEERLGAPVRMAAVAAIAVALVLLILLRSGVELPVVSNIARPLLAEREKTFQMEEIVRWLLGSEYAAYEPVFVRAVCTPKDASDSIDRRFRPPTNEKDLSMYVRALRGPSAPPLSADRFVVVGFGGESMPPGKLLLVLSAPNAGEARVVLPNQ
jgi:hypothetical protein